MKMMRVTGQNADRYNCQEAYANYNPKETVNCILSVMSEMLNISVEDVRKKLSQAFQHKEIVSINEEKHQDMVFRPDEMTLMFRANEDEVGMFTLTVEDVDAFFDGQPYTLSKFTEEEKEIALLVRKIMAEKMTDQGVELLTKLSKFKEMIGEVVKDIPGDIKEALIVVDVHLEREDVSELSISPGEFYANKLKCPVEEMLWAISQAYEKETDIPIPNMERGAVMFIDSDEVRVINGTDNITSVIHLDVLYELDENGEGHCPCPKCWNERREKDKTATAPINRTLH